MSKMNAIKTFRDLLSFLTIIPLAKTEEFVNTSSRNIFLFPIVGGLIGFLAALYFVLINNILPWMLGIVNLVFFIPTNFMVMILTPAMTIAFLLVLTGFQHFDGLIDLGNAIGFRKMEDRRAIAHRWVVTGRGAFFALFVEFCAFAGLILLTGNIAFFALIISEISAKLSMVTIVWRGKAAHQGLGARFIDNAKRKKNFSAYVISIILGYTFLGFVGIFVVLTSIAFGILMEVVANKIFGGVNGDIIGATNETSRALSLVLFSVFWILFRDGAFRGLLIL